MKISRSSLHYRYLDWLGFSAPSNLCPYFWKVVFAVLVPIAALAFVVAALFFLYGLGVWMWHHPIDIAKAVGFLVGAGLIVYGILWLAWSGGGRAARRQVAQTRVIGGLSDGASLVGNYLGAVHDKVCPRLDFVD